MIKDKDNKRGFSKRTVSDRKVSKSRGSFSIRFKLMIVYIIASFLVFMINSAMYLSINRMDNKIEEIYAGNIAISEVLASLNGTQNSLEEYLNTKSSDAMEAYYGYSQKLQEQLENLQIQVAEEKVQYMVNDVKHMTESYLEVTESTIYAKRGRLIGRYKLSFEKASHIYQYIQSYLNAVHQNVFQTNTENYEKLMETLQFMEVETAILMAGVMTITIVIIILLARNITYPLKNLAQSARKVAEGEFDVTLPVPDSNDEVRIVTLAFNQMLESLRINISKMKESMKKENELKEQQFQMETELKEAELRYLQAQIHPHFLFNTLNAGAQLAMLEEADRTYEYIQAVAKFFRYKIGRDDYETTLQDELQVIEQYIYIMNARFSGDIHYHKEIAKDCLSCQVPKMMLQPIVENAIKYGILGIEWEGWIHFFAYHESSSLVIEIVDNGHGMDKETLELLRQHKSQASPSDHSNGVGLLNVSNRLNLIYGEKGTLTISSEGENKGTRILIRIPYIDRSDKHV